MLLNYTRRLHSRSLSTQLDIIYNYTISQKSKVCLISPLPILSYFLNHVSLCLVVLAQTCFFYSDIRVISCHTFVCNYLVNPACTPANNRIECSFSPLIYKAITACAVLMGTCVWCMTGSVQPNKFLPSFVTPKIGLTSAKCSCSPLVLLFKLRNGCPKASASISA
jgi:hypothetical protein